MNRPARVAETLCQLLIYELVAIVELTDLSSEKDSETSGAENHAKLEALGYEVGFRFIEFVAQQRLLKTEPLEIIKFICREFWMEVFGKHIDKLQTNHRGVFVLKDNSFKWTSHLSSRNEISARKSWETIIKFPCGLLRGALSNLGYPAAISADIDSSGDRHAASFHVRLSP